MLLNYLEPSYSIGFLTIHLYGLFLALSIIAGLSVTLYFAKGRNFSADLIWELSIGVIIGAVIGARLLSVALNYELLLADPLYVFKIHEGGLAFYGGLGGGALTGYLLLRRKKISFWAAADLFAPALALGEGITRLGCDVYGIAASSAAPWPRVVNGAIYHNIPLYMIISSIMLFALLWYLKDRIGQGQLFLTYLAGYLASRIVIDFFRAEPLFSVFNGSQLASAVLLIAVASVILYRKNGKIQQR